MHSIRTIVVATAVAGWCSVNALAKVPKPLSVDFAKLSDGKGARVFNRTMTVSTEDGRPVARVGARAGDGGVLLDGVQLGEGTTEVDLKGKDVAQRSFLGMAFHVVDWTTLDAVYFRPFNFRGLEAERRSHCVQYVSHPAHTWQRLRAERLSGIRDRKPRPGADPRGH